MGSMSIWHWAIVIVVVALLFGGRGKLSSIMGDAAKGIRAFKDGLKDDDKKDGPHGGVSSLPRTDAEKEELKR
ncbi:twin-arginine translocase TatA/TatE family subunit [Brevundimonas sp.]|jgi:sec-independent protein translocase protein TatA|uniref:twin-arginine translocase TatA/TatE family subunit n=1 Tax=Brevundimonas sp. TaxID=1871086 RepID=UPI000DB4E808|nr:twin-arginine translocase TatA/TatE family subunit [Brevundimonas sp.]PZT97982.1 MAG: twin-arginine translocase TatA/TatE family subunit [Brevundimonas sp.]